MIKKISRYEIVNELGRGAMGVVYKAHDPVIDRILAIKLINIEPASFSVKKEEIKMRFLREAQSAGTLSHPNIVTIYDVGEEKDKAYIAMEFIDGITLSQIIDEGKKLGYETIFRIFTQVADALDYAHKKGIIHRDIKPANIMLTKEGRVKLCDFGIAKIKSSAHTTQTGIIVGTPFYMSPEQIKTENIDGRSDIFSLGIVLYELLSGDIPFKGETTSILYKIVHEDPPPPKLIMKDMPKFYETVILKALAKKPEDRYSACIDFAKDLERYKSKYLPKKKKKDSMDKETEKTFPLSKSEDYSISDIEVTDFIKDEYKPLTDAGETHAIRYHVRRTILLGLLLISIIAGAGYYGFLNGNKLMSLIFPSKVKLESNSKSQQITNIFKKNTVSKSLYINSEPPGASIFANGKDSGKKTPAALNLSGQNGSMHTIMLKKDFYADTSEQIALDQNTANELNFTLQSNIKEILINTEPAGATVALDDENLDEVTPATLNLSYGQTYKLKLMKKGYFDKIVEINAEDVESEVTFQLDVIPETGFLVVKGTYPVNIYSRNRLIERSVLNDNVSLLPGNHTLRIVNKEIFLNRTIQARIITKQSTEFTLPGLGSINVQTIPSNCKIYINDVFADYAPIFNRKIIAGEHTVKCVWADGKEYIKEVNVEVGRSAYVRANAQNIPN